MRFWNTLPYPPSLSRSKYRGTLSHGNTRAIWLAVHAADGLNLLLLVAEPSANI